MTVYMPDTDYKAICDATREKTGATGLLKSYEIKPLLEALETGGAKFTLTVNVDSGSVVTATKGGLSISGTAVNGVAVLELPEAGEWTVAATLDGQSASGVVQVVGDYAASVEFIPAFADATWAQIIEICQKRKVPEHWTVGSQNAMTINGASYLIDIIDKNHDAYSDGSGYAPLTLQLHDGYATGYAMHSSGTNTVGWEGCKMRKTYLPAILAAMPAEVQAGIREVDKCTSAGNKSSAIEITADKLFLLSEVEIWGSNTYSFAGEGAQYAYYAAGNNLVKQRDGAAVYWWQRSPRSTTTNQFCMVGDTGNAMYNAANYDTPATTFAFCF